MNSDEILLACQRGDREMTFSSKDLRGYYSKSMTAMSSPVRADSVAAPQSKNTAETSKL
jgi:hypothetical protein